MPEYIVADTEGSFGFDHIEAKDRETAVRRFVDTNQLGEDAMTIGVVLETDVAYYDIVQQAMYTLEKQK